ncbi:transcriptional regulator [Avibacterium paragallinarum]|uniref:Mu-like phage C protein, positive regulator of late transcription n=2 Tax=Avibacterium paragallinarum TaxID=728 RepID=H6U8H2_AVIPA|nr:Mor transcription activator family protein [Avibacterium paragallinarum]AFA44246.1 phage transcription regulator C [Avibacterium paragallinarum]POY47170.1 transcriptional regulator [Avibacterium paragallinarum]RZN58395.1 transcriptional regulator [Avibacterium paragallinarum]RZN76388.1 transcriptional regulator [Avibacterium paragallinarum]TID22481.1 transcriptional regulator [Avibacterium paragallinarum]
MDKQTDLFADDHEVLGQLLDNLDKIPVEELASRWPTTLAELLDVIACELVRQGESNENATRIASKIAGAIGHYLGGKSTYIPTGTVLKDALRDYLIYEQFNGKNIPELIREHKLSESHIYAIIRRQRALLQRRYQRELPFDSKV